MRRAIETFYLWMKNQMAYQIQSFRVAFEKTFWLMDGALLIAKRLLTFLYQKDEMGSRNR
jgi:hypothetical protein